MRHSLFLATALTLATPAAHAQPIAAAAAATSTVAERREVIAALADKLEARFLDPATGRAYAAAIRRKAAAGGYDGLDDGAFAQTVTADMRAVAPDGHLQLFAPRAPGAPGGPRTGPRGPEILRAGWIAPGVAYISFAFFHGEPEVMRQLAAFLDTHRDARALIIDAREHHGGGIDEMDTIFAAIFPKATELLWQDTRASVDDGPASAAQRDLAGPEGVVRRAHWATPARRQGRIARAPVFVLTSKTTVSAAEHLSLALKRTGRATLIGETTKGAGNYGQPFDLPHAYRAFIPYGRTFDPKTGRGWEGTGVAPDVAVPAPEALDVALKRLGVARSGSESLAAMKG